MRALATGVMLAAATMNAIPSAAETVIDWRPFVIEASQRFGIPVAWIERVMQAESGGKTRWGRRRTTSRAGAMGLMQVMPATWAELRAAHRLGIDPYDPHDNILAGTAYLRELYDRFGYPGLFAAYNAGPSRYADYLNGRPLPGETRGYLNKVAVGGRDTPAPQSAIAPPSLFALLYRGSDDRTARSPFAGVGLFAVDRTR